MTINKILVPVDFESASLEALRYAGFVAGQFGATVLAIHIAPDPSTALGPDLLVHIPGQPDESVWDFARRQSAVDLEALVGAEIPESVTSSTRVLFGSPEQRITEIARAEDIDLIVMGTHGRRGMEYVLLGSVAERVIRFAPCPVITTRGEPSAMEEADARH